MSPPQEDSSAPPPPLEELLTIHRARLVGFLRKEAGGLARFEDAEDLAQGVHLHALGVADRFTYQGEAAFIGWLFQVARQHVANRNAYWKALKRNAGTLLRLKFGASSESGGGAPAPALQMTGPQTFAGRREQLHVATRCIDALPERDQAIVRLVNEGASIDALASALGMSYDAAQRARHRALARFEKLFRIAIDRR